MAGSGASPQPSAPAAVDRAEELARRISGSAKYHSLDPEFVRRVSAEAAARFRDAPSALKYARRKLHQAVGSFATTGAAPAVAAAVAAVRSGGADLPTAARAAMRHHTSTAERLDYLEPFYQQVATWCGTPRSVVDLGCGLNPLAIPWMALAPDASYWCCDVDSDLVASLASLEQILPVRLTSASHDLVGSPPDLRAELALLLKTVATLEQQRSGAARVVLERLECDHVIVTFARRSITGRRGYTSDPRVLLDSVLAGSRYELSDQASFGGELAYHLVRAGGATGSAVATGSVGGTGSVGDTGPFGGTGSVGGTGSAGGTGPVALGSASGPEPASRPAAPAAARPPGAGGPGVLTLVGTPIGNLADLTDGAFAALRSADVICAEDTRRTRKLLTAYQIQPRQLVSVRAHNERAQVRRVLGWLAAGQQVAYVTDAGMPALSDPGQRLAQQVAEAGGRLAVAPGPDAATAALQVVGWPADRWWFEGFLPLKGSQRAHRLAEIAAADQLVVLFEAPHRLLRTLGDLAAAAGPQRPVAVVNDLTKWYERVWRGRLAEVAEQLAQAGPRGEFVLVLAPAAG